MKLALIGYGKMGKTIEKIARERGHKIVSIIDVNNLEDFDSENFRQADVAIEFTNFKSALDNYKKAFEHNIPVVSGTTGINDGLPLLKKEVEENGYTFLWSSNFSLGVNILLAVNKYLSNIMNQFSEYDVDITEIHHTQKLDVPSGTAITLAEGIIEKLNRKKKWVKDVQKNSDEIAIQSIRTDDVPGIHTVRYESQIDTIEITHNAKNRDGFAVGAVLAAEFLAGKKGWFTMADFLKF
ncbi:MAG TPA: 4-hydroxy-tetrahydrodipicolinate reductase [Paludibacteraceae bacterium]|nr:4-hydroxy-tetrahydrodipicolinate reductase [Paludibacteraceae bacterium]